MNKIRYITGDLVGLTYFGQFDVIVQGCNCFCKMRSGIAKQIAQTFSKNVEKDKETIPGDKSKLGTYNYCKYNTSDYLTPEYNMCYYDNHQNNVSVQYKLNHEYFVVNAYTQFDYGYDGKLRFSYKAFETICKKLNEEFKGKSIGFPWIGCGLAGGDRGKVKEIIERNMQDCEITICDFYS